MVELRGEPTSLDLLIRPFLRAIQIALSVLLVGVLACFGLWWWLPVPVILLEIGAELFLWQRGETSVSLALGDEIVVRDPLERELRRLDPATVTAACLAFRHHPAGFDVFVTLADDRGPRLAVRLDVEHFEPRPEDLDLGVMGAVIGGNPGILRALAPTAALCRQTLSDRGGQAISWLRTQLPPAAWTQVGVRGWRGREPPMDLLGMHAGPADLWLAVDAARWRLLDRDGAEVERGVLGRVDGGRAVRSAVLLRASDDAPGTPSGDTELPMLVIDLDAVVTIAFPSPLAGRLGAQRALTDDTVHLHLAEGARLAWHLLRTGHAPANLQEAAADARVAVGELPWPLGVDTGAR